MLHFTFRRHLYSNAQNALLGKNCNINPFEMSEIGSDTGNHFSRYFFMNKLTHILDREMEYFNNGFYSSCNKNLSSILFSTRFYI